MRSLQDNYSLEVVECVVKSAGFEALSLAVVECEVLKTKKRKVKSPIS
jgi:hypothetical protein